MRRGPAPRPESAGYLPGPPTPLVQATTTLGPGCDLYLLAPLVLVNVVTDGVGEGVVFMKIPGPGSAFAGCDAFFQYIIFDPLGDLNGQFAMSDALRIKVGN